MTDQTKCRHESFMNCYRPCERVASFVVPTQYGGLLVCRYHVIGYRRRGWQGIEKLDDRAAAPK